MASFRLWVFEHRGFIPVPFIGSLVLFSAPTHPYESSLDVLLDVLGVAVTAAGLALRAWAVGHAGPHTRSYKLRAPRLVTSGPYAHVRNPIYLGNLIIALGVVIMAESWIALAILLVGFSVQYGAIVSLEEEFLTRAFGQRYEEYCRQVPRWLPRLTSARSEAGGFSWRAIRKEHQAVLSGLAMIAVVELAKHVHRLFLR